MTEIRPRLLRTKQAAEYLNMSKWKIRQLIAEGKLPVVGGGEGQPFLLDIQDLDRLVDDIKVTRGLLD